MDDWSYDTAPDLQKSVAERLRSFPRYPDVTVHAVRTLLHIGLRAFLKSYLRLSVEGRKNLPAGGSFIMICNHSSHLDTLCLLSSLPLRRLHCAFPAGTTTPIVPCYLAGASEVLPKCAMFPRPRRLRLYIGTPRSFPQASPRDPEAVTSVCDVLRDEVLKLARDAASPLG